MKKIALIIVVAAGAALAIIGRQPLVVAWGYVMGEPFYQGWPASHWRRMLAGEPAQQAAAIQTFEGAGSEAAPVLAALLQDTRRSSADVRCLAAELLGKTGAGAEAASTSLTAALNDPDAHVRNVASAALPKAGVSADVAVPALLELLRREPNPVPLRALSEYREAAEPGLPMLEKTLADTKLDSEARWNAARTIGKIGAAAASAVPSLVAVLQDPAATVREHAAEALGDIGPPAAEAVQPLAAVLDDPAPRVRRDAVRSLGQIGPPARAVLPSIQKLLSDKEDMVRTAARNTLQAIAPETLPPKPAAKAAKAKEVAEDQGEHKR